MQTALADFIRDTPAGREGDAILRACVHCGFCTAVCPTYQLLGEENDGPRGRIYLIKQLLEGAEASVRTQRHLDRCLTCRACETACPSGVRYARLADIGRGVLAERRLRRPTERLWRWGLARILPNRRRFAALFALARMVRPFLPRALARKVTIPVPSAPARLAARHPRRMIALVGCVQPVLAPDINAAAARVLDRAGISLIEPEGAGCCGALRYHLDFQREGLEDARRLIAHWWPQIESGAEAIVITASGCAAMVKDYGELLREDPIWAEKARRVAALVRDPSEVVGSEWPRLAPRVRADGAPRIAFHSPCTLQHALRIRGAVEAILARAGFDLAPVAEGHLCCGSAGAYSLTEPGLSQRLLERKIAALTAARPQAIATANIGCLAHLQSGTGLPVRHWIALLDERLDG